MFQARDPGYSTVWKSKSSSCLQDMQQAWSSLHTCAEWPPRGPSKDSQHLPAAPQDRDLGPSSPATELFTQIPLSHTHIKVVTEINSYVGSSQLLDTNGCWVGRINQLCAHFKTLQLFPWQSLGRRVAATHGEINALCQSTKFNFQPYAGGKNRFPLLECWEFREL